MSSPLGTFLRTRRRQAPPPQAHPRRRTPGLRREEVAVSAAISVDYYTRLEQGRERNPSDGVLRAIGTVLGFSPDEHAHVRALRDGPGTGLPEAPAPTERLTALVDAVRPNPAYVLDRVSDVVAINPEGASLFDGLMEHAAPNTCRYLLTDPRARDRFVDWEDVARASVAALRAANGRCVSPRLAGLVTELRGASAEFESWWTSHSVAPRRAAVKRFRDASGGITAYAYEVLRFPDPGLRMTLYLAPGDSSGG